jgi:phage protein D
MMTSQISTVRHPACIILLDGQFLVWETAQIINKNYYMADTYEITLPLNSNPSFGLDFWASVQTAEIQIYAGFPPDIQSFTQNDLTLLFTGGLDAINVNPCTRMVTLNGRDYAYLLIDKKITQTYVNQTASQIAIQFAQENGLTPVVTPTTTPVGQYTRGYTQTAHGITQWDFLTFLAQQTNFNVYVINKELHFEPKPLANAPAYVINYTPESATSSTPLINVVDLSFGRTLTLAEDITVKLRSNSQVSGKSFTVTATAHHTKDPQKAPKQTYVYSIPNLTPAQASAQAQVILSQLTQHEVQLNYTVPADVTLTKVTPVQISGTQSAFDQVYYIDSITRSISVAEGFTQTVGLKNHDTNTQVIL